MNGIDLIVSLKVAELARKKGFEERTDVGYCYDVGKGAYYLNYDQDYFLNPSLWEKHFAAPTREQLNLWLRNKGIFITIEVDQTFEPKFCYHIATFDQATYEWKNLDPTGTTLFYKYEQALEDGLEEALKLVCE
jgi:hypothetical protein